MFTGTHFYQKIINGFQLLTRYLDPICEIANKYSLSIQIHPYNAEKMVNLEDKFWRFHLVWMLAQCADTFHLYTLKVFQINTHKSEHVLLMVVF